MLTDGAAMTHELYLAPYGDKAGYELIILSVFNRQMLASSNVLRCKYMSRQDETKNIALTMPKKAIKREILWKQ
jgi:hypothetical protein